ncbi:MAG: hypothetical protein Q7T49_00540 [bacterium]|nr:hypothetical protein [bacterium]
MRISSAILIISGLLLLSFLGAAMPIHSSGHSTCLASILLGADCPPLVSDLAAAIFHTQMFVSLFSLILIANLLGLSIYLFSFYYLQSDVNKNRQFISRGKILSSVNLSKYHQSYLQWLVNLEHSPTF